MKPTKAKCEPAAVNWSDAKRRVLKSYREWIRSVRFPNSHRALEDIQGELSDWANFEGTGANGGDRQAPEIQSMYSLGMPVSQLRTKMRQEFERHRYVNQLPVVDMLLFQSHAEYQVRGSFVWILGGNVRRKEGFSWQDQT